MVSARRSPRPIRTTLAAIEARGTRPDGSPNRVFFLVAFGAAYVLFVVTYLPINFYSVGRPAHELYLPGESSLPFIPEFEFLYVLGYALPAVAVFTVPSARHFSQLVVAFLQVEEGFVVRNDVVYDSGAVVEQLGFRPGSDAAGDRFRAGWATLRGRWRDRRADA